MSGETVRFGIFQRLLLTFLAVSLLPVFLLWLVGRAQLVEEAETAANHHLRLTAQRLRENVDGWSAHNLAALNLLARAPAVRSLDAAQGKPLMRAVGEVAPWVYLTHVMNAEGMDVVRNDEANPAPYGDRRYFKEVMSGAPVSTEVVIGKTSGKPAAVIAVPVKDEAGATVGSASVAGSLEDLTKAFAGTRFGRTGFAFLLQADGKLITSPQEQVGKELKDYSQHPAYQSYINQRGNPVRYVENGREVIAHVEPTRLGWLTVVQQDADESLQGVAEADRKAVFALVLALALAGAAAWLLARGIARPIQRLTAVAEQISRGELDHALPEAARQDEIGALARAIGRLSKSVKLAMDRLRIAA